MNYRFLKIASFYTSFLDSYYKRNPTIINECYKSQYEHIMSQGHAWANYFQNHLNKIGNEAFEIIHNAPILQSAWATEYGYNNSKVILIEQIKYYKPDVVFFQDSIAFSADFFTEIKRIVPSIKLLIGFCCTPYSKENVKAFKRLDLLLTCSPHFLNKFKSYGINTQLFYHAFEDSLLAKVNIENDWPSTDLLFIGSFIQNKEYHDGRLLFIEEMLKSNLPLSIYTNLKVDNIFRLYAKKMTYIFIRILRKIGLSKLIFKIPYLKKLVVLNEIPKKQKFSNEFKKRIVNDFVFGLDMLKLVSKSKISLNIHGSGAGDYAANLRLFEVTGVGSLLLTDYKKNITDLFVPDVEIVTYKSVYECIEKAKWLLNNSEESKKIAKAGQIRTLKDHTIKSRVSELNEIISGLLKKC